MITLGTQIASYNGDVPNFDRQTVRISTDPHRPNALRKREAFIAATDNVPAGFGWYIFVGRPASDIGAPTIELPAEFSHLSDGDVVRLAPAKHSLRVLFRRNASINSLLLTERCNNFCLMCSQPPRNVNDGWIVDEILEVFPLIDPAVPEIMFSGGEPTLLGERFFELVRACKSYLPHTALHILSNGRAFAKVDFAATLGRIQHPDIMLGIPVYSDLPHIHDYVVQADGAYDETLRGILNLRQSGVPIEIRVVLHKQTVSRLPALAEFITRNLLFVDHVALMGLEMTGFTKANLEDLWIDPIDYQSELRRAVGILERAKIRTSIYNSQLCLLDRSLWRFARQSISDWKQEYLPECQRCSVKDQCGGFFSSYELRYSSHIAAIGTPAGNG